MIKLSHTLGYAGLIPFVFLPLFMVNGQLAFFEGTLYFTQYSAIILSFLGGVLWYDGLQKPGSNPQLMIAMLPSVIGWLSLVLLPPVIIIWVLTFALLAVLIYDHIALKTPPEGYLKLRVRLTSITLGTHLTMLWLYYGEL